MHVQTCRGARSLPALGRAPRRGPPGSLSRVPRRLGILPTLGGTRSWGLQPRRGGPPLPALGRLPRWGPWGLLSNVGHVQSSDREVAVRGELSAVPGPGRRRGVPRWQSPLPSMRASRTRAPGSPWRMPRAVVGVWGEAGEPSPALLHRHSSPGVTAPLRCQPAPPPPLLVIICNQTHTSARRAAGGRAGA